MYITYICLHVMTVNEAPRWVRLNAVKLNGFQHHGQLNKAPKSPQWLHLENHSPPISGRSFLSYSFSKLFNICVVSVSWVLGANIWFTVTSSYSSSEATVWELKKKIYSTGHRWGFNLFKDTSINVLNTTTAIG